MKSPFEGVPSADQTRETGVNLQELAASEGAKLTEFFGRAIDVPPPPAEVTPERAAELKRLGFEIHFLPAIELKADVDFPGWLRKPDGWFYRQIEAGALKPDAATLPGAWIAIDARRRPDYAEDQQMYEDDPLAPALAKLREHGAIETEFSKVPDGSRFGVSAQELAQPEVRAALAGALGATPETFRLPRSIELNVLGNLHHLEWSEADGWEWLGDRWKKDGQLMGGRAETDDTTVAGGTEAKNRSGRVGFRPMLRFAK
jgi:hypothetical protein